MANQIVLEELVVRLLGDNSSLIKMAETSATAIRTMTNRMYTAMSRAERFAGTLIKGLGSFGLASGLRGMFQQFADLEQGQIRLNAAIRGGGHDAEALTARYMRVAESLSQVTLNSKGSILGLFQQAEAAQLSGDKAEQAVRYSIALAGATGQSADAMMRTAIQLAKGHPEFAKRILNLREVANGSELVDAIMRKMNTGMEIATAEFNSANGRMERLGRAFKSLGQDIGGMIAAVLLPVVGMVQQLADGFKTLEPATKKQIALVLGLVVAWLGMAPVTQVLKDLLTPTFHLLKFLMISLPLTILNTVAWLAWKTVLGLAAIAVFTLAGFIWLLSSGQVFSKIATLLLSGAMLIWKGAIWLVNAALTVMNLLLSPAVILAAVATVVVLGAAFFVAYSAIASVVNALKAIPALGGPLRAITAILGEWWGMLKEIFTVAQSDMPRAWRMMQAGFALAVQQMKDLWTPLWQFITDGFGLVWEAIANSFKSRMQSATATVLRSMTLLIPGAGAAVTEIEQNIRPPAFFVNQMRRDLTGLAAGFNVLESAETRAARALYQALVPVRGLVNDGLPGLPRVEASMKKIADHAQRFDAALSGSVEAMARMAEYQDKIRFDQERIGAGTPQQAMVGIAAAGAMASGGSVGTTPVVNVLLQILGQLQQTPVLQLRAAGLGGA